MFKKNSIAFLMSFILIITIIPVGISTYNNVEYRGVNVTYPYTFYNYSTMTQLLKELAENNPDIMSLNSIGVTYEGRDIWMVKLSDNVNI